MEAVLFIFSQNGPIFSVFSPIYDFNDVVAKKLKVPPAGSMYLLSLIFSLVLSALYRFIPRKWVKVKYSYNFFFGFFMLAIQFNWAVFHTLITAGVGYILLRRTSAKTCNTLTSIFVFTYLSLFQIYELYHYYLIKRPSYRSPQMLMTLKLIAIPFNLYDGTRLKNDKSGGVKGQYSRHQREVAISKPPGLLQYFSFLFYYGAVNSGPIIEYKHYVDFVENQKAFPMDFVTIVIRLLYTITAFFSFLISQKLKLTIPFIKYEATKDKMIIEVVVITVVVVFCSRIKYYFAWLFAETSLITAGCGFSGKDESTDRWKWENVKSSNIITFETSKSVRTNINNWNISVSKWFRHYVYERVSFKSKTLNMIAPMCVSAFWHGFYPGYYMFWSVLIVLNMVYIDIYRKIRPRIRRLTPKWFFDIVFCLVTHVLLSHFGAPFLLLSLQESVLYYGKFYYLSHAGLFLIFVVLKLIPKFKMDKKGD